MRVFTTLLAATALAYAVIPAHAATIITETETGVVSGTSTIDTTGLFGTAGADLAGKAITVHTQYVPNYFGAVTQCGHNSPCSYAISKGSTNTPGALLITVTINGKQLTYTSAHFGEVLFSRGSQNLFYSYADTSSFGAGYNGCAVWSSFSSPVTFGSTLSPTNPPALNTNIDTIEFFIPTSSVPATTLTFAVTSATE